MNVSKEECLSLNGSWVKATLLNNQTITGVLRVETVLGGEVELYVGLFLLPTDQLDTLERETNKSPLPDTPKSKVVEIVLKDGRIITSPSLSADGKWYGLDQEAMMVAAEVGDIVDWH